MIDQLVGTWRIVSQFDSGNLASAVLQADGTVVGRTAPDGPGLEGACRTWFYFAVAKVGAPAAPTLLRMTVAGLNKQGRLYGQGLQPITSTADTLAGPKGQWHRGCQRVSHASAPSDFSVSFEYSFAALAPGSWAFFAFCYPFSYDECQAQLADLDMQHGSMGEARRGIYYHRELLTRSLDGRRVDLLTITDPDGHEADPLDGPREARLDALFPDDTPRPHCFPHKKMFFLTARVHPGETPASHVFNGFLAFILDQNDIRAALLRRYFVFKLIPMLNPDGVARGHYRTDTLCQNLNRCYNDPDPATQPTIFATRTLLVHYAQCGMLQYYVDLHAHANKRGSFIYGNHLEGPRQVENILFAKLVAHNSLHFDYEACNFTEENMFSKDKRDGMATKEGSGRVGVFLATNMTHCYTLESNYNSGRVVNALPPCAGGGPAHEKAVLGGGSVIYDLSHWHDCGRGVALAALDMLNRNPWSRLPASEYKSLAGLRKHIAATVDTRPRVGSALRKATKAADFAGLKAPAAASNDAASKMPSRRPLAAPRSLPAAPSNAARDPDDSDGHGDSAGRDSEDTTKAGVAPHRRPVAATRPSPLAIHREQPSTVPRKVAPSLQPASEQARAPLPLGSALVGLAGADACVVRAALPQGKLLALRGSVPPCRIPRPSAASTGAQSSGAGSTPGHLKQGKPFL